MLVLLSSPFYIAANEIPSSDPFSVSKLYHFSIATTRKCRRKKRDVCSRLCDSLFSASPTVSYARYRLELIRPDPTPWNRSPRILSRIRFVSHFARLRGSRTKQAHLQPLAVASLLFYSVADIFEGCISVEYPVVVSRKSRSSFRDSIRRCNSPSFGGFRRSLRSPSVASVCNNLPDTERRLTFCRASRTREVSQNCENSLKAFVSLSLDCCEAHTGHLHAQIL